jgi:snurportin-1
MPRFPSALPPLTILYGIPLLLEFQCGIELVFFLFARDCILDNNWRENGILHILDVLKWKGQDIADCETPFR